MTMRLFFLILFALSTLVQTRASRALPITFRVKLTDGTEQTVRLCGDENSHFYLTEQGEMVLREGSTWRKATTLEVSETRRQFETISVRCSTWRFRRHHPLRFPSPCQPQTVRSHTTALPTCWL